VTRCRVYAAQVVSLTHFINTLLNGSFREPERVVGDGDKLRVGVGRDRPRFPRAFQILSIAASSGGWRKNRLGKTSD